MKPHLIVDMSESAINAHAMTPSFHMGCLDDLVQFITPGCFIATAHISSYYNNFPLAESARRNFAILWLFTFFVLGYLFRVRAGAVLLHHVDRRDTSMGPRGGHPGCRLHE